MTPRRGAGGVRRGFTLLELVVVLLLLGLLTTASVPALRAVDGVESSLDVGARDLATLLRRLQRTAVERGRPVVLGFGPASGRYRVELTAENGDVVVLEDSVLLIAPRLTARADISAVGAVSATDTLAMRWRATPLGGIAGPALLLQDGAQIRRITVDPWTADVRVDAR